MKFDPNFANNKAGRAAKKVLEPMLQFLAIQSSGGIILLLTTFMALLLANFPTRDLYFGLIKTPIILEIGNLHLDKNLLLLVNDGLMAIFFYLVGLEIKREVLIGELSTPKKASFSIFAAIGGMLVPALIFIMCNWQGTHFNGWAIPMATDIAFAIGILTLLGKRVPAALKIFLLALAIVDDLGAILVIAFFYTSEISSNYLGIASILLLLLFLLNHAGLRNIAIGLILGVLVWFCFLKSGIHATIAGVLLALLTPARPIEGSKSELSGDGLLIDRYIQALHPWVAFVIMPVFAFVNAGVYFGEVDISLLMKSNVFLGIVLGLVVGKPLGITLVTFLATRLGIATKSESISWFQVFSVSLLAGIGFTMSLFVSSLAFSGDEIESYAKIAILAGSAVAAIGGLLLVFLSLETHSAKEVNEPN